MESAGRSRELLVMTAQARSKTRFSLTREARGFSAAIAARTECGALPNFAGITFDNQYRSSRTRFGADSQPRFAGRAFDTLHRGLLLRLSLGRNHSPGLRLRARAKCVGALFSPGWRSFRQNRFDQGLHPHSQA